MSNLADTLIETVDLVKEYETPAGDISVLKSVQFSVKKGEMVFIVGRSGSGKSTLLHLLGGLDKATSGQVLFEGKDMGSMSERKLAKIRNKRIGFIFQFYHLLPELTVFENVLLPMLISGKRNNEWVKEILKRVKLYSRRAHFPSELSGGEKQRVAIARALINKPSVVLCDEPTGNLDKETADSVFSLLKELNTQDGQAFVIITHNESMSRGQGRTLVLEDGYLNKKDGKFSIEDKIRSSLEKIQGTGEII